MTKTVLDEVANLYSESFKEHGIDARGVGWTDEKRHWLRLSKLCELVVNDERFSVNDLGCGYGALHTHLIEQGKFLTMYNGYEISAEMLNAARTYLPTESVKVIEGSKLSTMADYSFASGIFNVRFSESDAVWLKYIEDTLYNLSESSSKGFAFNLLTSYVDWKEGHLYYADPMYFFDLCKKNFSKKVCLLHDYDLWEWTLVVRKD